MKILNYFKNNIFFFALFILLMYSILYFILDLVGLTFLNWVRVIFEGAIFICFVIGIMQGILKIQNKVLKVIYFILLGIFLIFLYFAVKILYVFGISIYLPEYTAQKDGVKYVVYVDNFILSDARYFKYENIFVRDNTIEFKEDYGFAKYNPFEENTRKIRNVTYYDENGKKLEDTESSDGLVQNIVSNEINSNFENVIIDKDVLENIWGN